MNWLLTGEIMGGILGYLSVMAGIFYVDGRINPYHSGDIGLTLCALFWPAAMLLFIPGFIIYWICYFFIHVNNVGSRHTILKREASRQVERIDMFEGDNTAL